LGRRHLACEVPPALPNDSSPRRRRVTRECAVTGIAVGLPKRDSKRSPLALLGQFFAARSIIEVALRSHRLAGRAHFCLGKRTGKSLAVLSICEVTPPASPVRYLAETAAIADRDLTTPKTGGVEIATSSLLAAGTERVPALPRWFTFVVLRLFSGAGGYVLFARPSLSDAVSSSSVTGPSLSTSTRISARNRPVSTRG
jgi:hypothetical protein